MLSKYEVSQILGIRILQLSENSPQTVCVPDYLRDNLMYIALKELTEKRLKIHIFRPLPNGKTCEVNVQNEELAEDAYILLDMLAYDDRNDSMYFFNQNTFA